MGEATTGTGLDRKPRRGDRVAVDVPGYAAGDVARALATAQRPDVVVVDPPRGGLHPDVVDALAARLLAAGWSLTRVRPIDLFAHTPHLECVRILERRP
jgi:23S rRNA (uracil1939-C5)-methyltransferase